MNRLLLPTFALVAVALAGCGDPAPSIPVAPDQKMPDTSKMSQEEINKLHMQGSQGGSDRGAAGSGPGAPVGRPGDTPADRQTGG